MLTQLKEQIGTLRADLHMREVAKGASVALLLKVTAAGLAFGFNVAVARLLGADGAGLFFLALSIATLGSVIGRLGLDNTMLRFVAAHATLEEWDKVRGVFVLGVRMSIVAAGSVTVGLFFLAPWIATSLCDKPELVAPLRWMSLSVLPFSLFNLQAESLKGLRCIRDAMLVKVVYVPLLSLLIIGPLAAWQGVVGAVFAYLAAAVVTVFLGFWYWRRSVGGKGVFTEPFSLREMWASCGPLLTVSMANQLLMPWFPLFVLGFWVPSEDVGLYGVASRTAMLTSIVLLAVASIAAPKFASLYKSGNMDGLQRIAKQVTLFITVLAAPVMVLFMAFPEEVLQIFGEEFLRASNILIILSLGQLVNVICGPVGYLLIMTGHEKALRNNTVVCAITNLAASLFLIPVAGAVGAAASMAFMIATKNIVSLLLVKKYLKINMFGNPFSIRAAP